MTFVDWLMLLIVFAAAALWFGSWRSAPGPTGPTSYLALAPPWKGPPPGFWFAHCGRLCVVIWDGVSTGDDWSAGVLSHYADEGGHIHQLFFTPAQWEALNFQPIKREETP